MRPAALPQDEPDPRLQAEAAEGPQEIPGDILAAAELGVGLQEFTESFDYEVLLTE